MKPLLYLLLFAALLKIVEEDFRFRAIWWVWIPVLIALSLGLALHENSLSAIGGFFTINLLFISVQLVGVSLYYTLKAKRLVNIADQYLGWGDILFFLPLCFLFSPINFIGVFIIALLFILAAFLFLKRFFLPDLQTIPLAGGLAIVVMVFLILEYFTAWDRYVTPALADMLR